MSQKLFGSEDGEGSDGGCPAIAGHNIKYRFGIGQGGPMPNFIDDTINNESMVSGSL